VAADSIEKMEIMRGNMQLDQIYYTSATTGIRGGAGFQVNAHSGVQEPDILREIEAYALYSPPSNCPRTPDTEEELALFPVAYKYRIYCGRRPGFSRSKYLGKDYNSVRYGNFFTHILLAPEHTDPSNLLDPAVLRALPIWAGQASQQVEIDKLDIGQELFKANYVGAELLSHSRFQDLLSFALASLGERKATVIVDDPDQVVAWISTLQKVLPPNLRKQLFYSTYEHKPQNTDFVVCGTTPDAGFELTEASFNLNFYVLDFSSNRFSPSLEHGRFADLIASLGSEGDLSRIQAFLDFACDMVAEPDPSQLNSLTELWLLVQDQQQTSSLLRAMELLREFGCQPSEVLSKKLQQWIETTSGFSAEELREIRDFCLDFVIPAETVPFRKIAWTSSLFLALLHNYTVAEPTELERLATLMQAQGGVLALESYDMHITAIKNILARPGENKLPLLKACWELFLMDHPELTVYLEATFRRLFEVGAEGTETFDFICKCVEEQVPVVEKVLIELLSRENLPAPLISLLFKLTSYSAAQVSLNEIGQASGNSDVMNVLELLNIFSRHDWENAAKLWWQASSRSPASDRHRARFWELASRLKPGWAPRAFLNDDPSLILQPAFQNTFWKLMAAYDPTRDYDRDTSQLLTNLRAWCSQAEQNGVTDVRNVCCFLRHHHTIFTSTEASPLNAVKGIMDAVPQEHESCRLHLATKLIRRLNTPTRKSSDWESLLTAIQARIPAAIAHFLKSEATIVKDYPSVFWIGLARLAANQETAMQDPLQKEIKQAIRSLSAEKRNAIFEKVQDKPELAAYFGDKTKASLINRIKRIFGLGRK